MQTTSATMLTALQATTKQLTWLVEFYHQDAVPTAAGFDPASDDFLFGFSKIKASGETDGLTFRTRSFVRKILKVGTVNKKIGKELNSFDVTLSNMDRSVWGFERDYGFEGLICVARIVKWNGLGSAVLADSAVAFTGRCGKVQNFSRRDESCSVPVRQIVNATDTDLLRRTFSPNDKLGRSPSDPLFEGFRFTQRTGSVTYEEKVKKRFLFFFTRTKTERRTLQYSSHSDISSSTFVPLVLGRAQCPGLIIGYEDIGTQINFVAAFADGYSDGITSYEEIRSLEAARPIGGTAEKYGTAGGTGSQTNDDPNWVAAGIYSRLAYIRAYATGSELSQDDPAPEVVAIVYGLKISTPDSAGDFVDTEWSDNPVEQARWVLTNEFLFNLDEAWLDDADILTNAEYCDHILVDTENTDTVLLPSPQSAYSGLQYKNYFSSARVSPEFWHYEYDNGTSQAYAYLELTPEFYENPPFNSDDFDGDGVPDITYGGAAQSFLRRYTSNVRVGEQMKCLDFLDKILFPTANLYLTQNANGLISVRVNRPVDTTFMKVASIATDTEIDVFNVRPWIGNFGRILIGANTSTSEVRTITAYVYTAGGQTITVDAGASVSTATLMNGTSTIAPYSTITVSSATGTRTLTIAGYAMTYTCGATDNTTTVAGMLAALVNSHPILNKSVKATWNKNTTVLVESREGTLTLDSALENAHATSIADPTTAPVCVVGGGGDLEAGTYLLAYSLDAGTGETLTTANQSLIVASGQNIVTPAFTPPAGTTVNWYCSVEPSGVRLHRVPGAPNDGSSFAISKANLPGVTDPPEPNVNLTAEEVHHVAMAFSDVAETQSALTRSNMLKGTFRFPGGNRQASINQVFMKYRDASQDFTLTEYTINDVVHQDKIKKVNRLEIDGAAIDNHHQARRIANQALNANREGDHFHGFSADGEATLLEVGDVICVTDSSGEFVNEPIRVEEVSIDDNEGYPSIEIVGRKYRRWHYDDQSTEKIVPLSVVTNSSPNTNTTAPQIVASDTPLNTTVNFEVEDYSNTIKYVKWELDKVATFDGGDYEYNIVSAESGALRTFEKTQPVTKSASEATAEAWYVRQSVSSNGLQFSEPSEEVTITFADSGDSGGVGMSAPPSGLSGVWDDAATEVDLQWTRGGGSAAQTLQRKLSTDPPASWANVTTAIGSGATTYSNTGLTKSQSGAVTYHYRLRDNTLEGWTNTASVVVPIADNPPNISGVWDDPNLEIDLTITPGNAAGSGDYTIEHKTTGAFATLVTQAGTTYSHARTKAASAVDNHYRVKRAVPSGEYGNTTTIQVPANASPPTLNTVTSTPDDTVNFDSWTANGGAGAYTLQVRKNGFSYPDTTYGGSGTATSGATSGTVVVAVNVTYKTLFYARVKRDDVSGWSNEVAVFIEAL